MKEYAVRLNPRSSFEISLHSDTIFGAICWGIRTLFGEVKLLSILEEFQSKPPFIVSSAFPFKKTDEKYTYYLPKPIMKPIGFTDLEKLIETIKLERELYHSKKFVIVQLASRYKKFRKLRWVPFNIFKKTTRNLSEKELFRDYLEGWFKNPNYAEIGATQRNSIDRLVTSTSGSGETFYSVESFFREDHGLYFFLKTNNMDEYLLSVLKFLEDSGIGPNARTGKNWFTVDINETSLLDGAETESFITLSRCVGIDTIDTSKSFYRIVPVRSKVESRQEFAGQDIWKDKVMYFEEGSTIKPDKKVDFYGSLVPVKKIAGKTIYQYGYAYPVWVHQGVKYEM